MPTLTRFNINDNPRARFLAADNPIIEPLGGMIPVESLMERFPETLYNRGRDSHLYNLMVALTGESGAGALKKRTVASRLKNEGPLLVFKDLDTLYAQTFYFKRLPREIYSYDAANSIIEKQIWDKIYAADQSYKKRIKDYFNGVRLGSSPLGITLVARAGSGEDVDVYENYKYVFDQISDDRIGIERVGFSGSTEEFVIVPRVVPNVSSITNKATIKFSGIPTGGTYQIGFGAFPLTTVLFSLLDNAATRSIHIKMALESYAPLSGFVQVAPLSDSEYEVTITDPSLTAFDVKANPEFQGSLTGVSADVSVVYNLSDTYYVARFGGPNQDFYNNTKANIVDPSVQNYSTENTIMMDPSIERNMLDNIDRLRPTHTVMTVRAAIKRHIPVGVRSVVATSENITMTRFVSGRKDVPWPNVDPAKGYFVQGTVVVSNEATGFIPTTVEVENEAPSMAFGSRAMPVIFQDIGAIFTYTNEALFDSLYNTSEFYSSRYDYYSSVHVGTFDRMMVLIYRTLAGVDPNDVFSSIYVKANQETPILYTAGVK